MINTLFLKIFYIRWISEMVFHFCHSIKLKYSRYCWPTYNGTLILDYALLFAWYGNKSINSIGLYQHIKIKAIWRATVRNCPVSRHLHVWCVLLLDQGSWSIFFAIKMWFLNFIIINVVFSRSILLHFQFTGAIILYISSLLYSLLSSINHHQYACARNS